MDALWRDSHVRSVNGRWGYHLSALPFVVGKNAIVGLNWGAKNPAHYGPQTTEPAYKDSEIRQWDFIGDYLPLIRRYLGEVTRGEMNYFNLSPLRSSGTDDIDSDDWRKSIESFFMPTVEYLQAPITLLVGSTAVRLLGRHLRLRQVAIPDSTMRGHRGVLVGASGTHHQVRVVPHPAYVRRQLGTRTNVSQRMSPLWEAVFTS